PQIDSYDNNADYTIHCSLPGVKSKDIEVIYDKEHNQVIIKGKYLESCKQSTENITIRERWSGSFERKITLPLTQNQTISSDDIKASLKSGVLEVTILKGKKLENKLKRIPVAT
ncbi:HSP20-like chaperone, partial [Nadsonia fulvescens var. elongata DSM 6958]